MTHTSVHEDIVQLIERLKPVSNLLEQNSYIKATTNKLKRLIADAQLPTTILFIGKERVGKTATINSFLGRNVLASSVEMPTQVNTFIKFGEREHINAVFYDGVEITFDLNKLPLLTVSDTESAQIIREHMDYLEIYLQNKALEQVVLIDSTAIEGDFQKAYFSPFVLDRVDEIFWLIRAGSPMTEAEVELLQKVSSDKEKPYVIINAIDSYEGNIDTFIQQERAKYGQYVEDFIAISAKDAMEAAKQNDSQKLIDSNFTQLNQLVQTLKVKNNQKMNKLMQRLVEWLQLFQMEMQQIPNREPLVSAAYSVIQFNEEHNSGASKEERDRVIIQAYRDEYEEVCNVFQHVETLYQLLQTLASTFYLRDQQVEQFEELAFAYQQNVRDYRKKHTEYTQLYSRAEEQYRKEFKRYLQQWSKQHTNDQISLRVENLKNLYTDLKDLVGIINIQQKQLLQLFYQTQNHLMELAKKRMNYITKQLAELDNKRKVEVVYLKSYNEKLKEFGCVESAQKFLLEGVKPFVEQESEGLDDSLKAQFENVFNELSQVKWTLPNLEEEQLRNQPVANFQHLDFESEFTLIPLSLTEADIISDIPALPASI